ncbi:MAG: hypothetical protein NC548_31845 [Lachnospiraceae bacterium]|nr:hypothetical protein [Lachnospiraceae bacterium]
MATNETSSPRKIKEYLLRCIDIADQYTYQALAKLAEECVNRIRDRSAEDSWIDHTGNLRSSIGYVIIRNGVPINKGGFRSTQAPDGNGADGQTKGQNYATSLATQFSSSPFALIVVAGMEYAMYVEAHDNKDVLASTHAWALSEWPNRAKRLKKAIEDAWVKLEQQMKIA